ncbi:hypothetical protein OH76DRAFT_989504 [Lentinus brumalis]|uniref:Uncharacterized protein n=1 Tax=Lentinus brumalis TaxID=2498619 RepID=A0A371DQ98_9APHY|nr:hypothetical protein OH76DRAFT_989504 [Polyporus brumalis]
MTITIAYIQSIIVQLLSHGTPCKRHAISTMISPLARSTEPEVIAVGCQLLIILRYFTGTSRLIVGGLGHRYGINNAILCSVYDTGMILRTMKGAGVDNRRQTYDGERQQLHGHGNEQARAQSARRKRQEPARGHRTRSSRSEQVVPAMQRETQRRRNNCRPQEDSP